MILIKKLNNILEYDDVIEHHHKVIFYFRDAFCQDCLKLEKYIDQVKREYSDFYWVYINKREFIVLFDHLFIYGVPSFLVFIDQQEVGRFVDKKPKTYDEIINFLNKAVR